MCCERNFFFSFSSSIYLTIWSTNGCLPTYFTNNGKTYVKDGILFKVNIFFNKWFSFEIKLSKHHFPNVTYIPCFVANAKIDQEICTFHKWYDNPLQFYSNELYRIPFDTDWRREKKIGERKLNRKIVRKHRFLYYSVRSTLSLGCHSILGFLLPTPVS